MIARDEERMLPGCLDSVKGLVDEVVLVDTGSRDATREIAERRGARVYARDWDDDFATPRNLAIERATGDWILVLDADERLAPAGFGAIRRAVKRRDIDVGLLRLHDAARADATAAEVLEGAARLGEPNLVPRLLRRTPDLRYHGIVHEEVADWLAARKGGLDAVDADIVHLGAVPALRDARGKRERNVLLLEKRCRIEPGSVVPMGYLAMEYWKSGRFGEARAVAERAWQMIDAQPVHRSAYLVGVVRAFSQVKEEDEAGLRETLARMVGREGVRRDFSFLAGVAEELRALRSVGRDRREPLEAAVAAYRGLTGAVLPPEERGCIDGAAGWGARIRAGTVLLQLGRTGEAQEEFRAALAAVPGNEEAILGAAESALDLGDAAGALERLAPLLDGGHERPDGWMLAAAASVKASGSGEVVSGLLARARALEPRGFVASHRAERLHALCAPGRPRLSLCMIVRNEEEMLPPCLESVRGVVDEIVIVDTGSSDATRELARRAGARVLERPWDDDFAAPRNLALRHATGDWVLQLDADERLAPGSAEGLRAAMAREDLDLGTLRLHDARRVDAPVAAVVSGRERMGAPTLVPRLMRRTEDLAYRGIVHESVEAWLERRGHRVDAVDADIVHLGAVPDRRATLGKRSRNVALLERRCRLEPDSITPFGFLAMEQLEAGRIAEARETAETGWKILGGQPPRRSAHLLGVARALCQARAGEHAAMAETVEVLVHREGPGSDAALLRGLAREISARALAGTDRESRLEAAAAAFREALAPGGASQQRVCVAGSDGWFAWTRLGAVSLLLGQAGEAIAHFRRALADQPGNLEALLGEAEALLDSGAPGKALERLEPILREHGGVPDGWVLAAAAARVLGAAPDSRAMLDRAAERVGAGFVGPHRAVRHLSLLAPPGGAPPAPSARAGR